MTDDFCKFPEDMVVHILSRLPPKSLIRFKCIHKSFLTIIETSQFVANHLSNSTQYVLLKQTSSNVCYGAEELEDNRIIIFPPRVEVHILGTNSWQEISFSNLETQSTIFWPMYYPCYFKGICYWIGHEQQKEFTNCYCKNDYEYIRILIVYFDMDREMFNSVLLPEELNSPESFAIFMRISVWNDSLAAFGFYYIHELVEPEHIGIWVLDDTDGVKDSWTLKQSFLLPPIGSQGLLYLWKSDEMIILCHDRLVSYNFETKEINLFLSLRVYGGMILKFLSL